MNRIVLLNAVEVGMKVVALSLLAVFVLWLGFGVTGAVWADFTLAVGTAVVLVVILARLGVGGRPAIDRALWTRTWAFAFPTYCAGVMTYLNYRVDQFIIAALLLTTLGAHKMRQLSALRGTNPVSQAGR